MELKSYQVKTLKAVESFLSNLVATEAAYDVVRASIPPGTPTPPLDAPEAAFRAATGRSYKSSKDGTGRDLPGICLKVPTGGGKTLLACHSIELVNRLYRQRSTGLVLWVVPTQQIYSQTLRSLRDRSHPYRQVLEMASGGRVKVIQKMDRFTPVDLTESLVVLMLMLPSANRRDKETLKVFRDSGGYLDFFPVEDDRQANEALLVETPNLEPIGEDPGILGFVPKASLGNVVRMSRPVVILDEGHKAYSRGARDTLYGLNPSVLIELSATPPDEANKLVAITGTELLAEGMIKLPLHIARKASVDWRDTVRATIERVDSLTDAAQKHEANSGQYIRPIALVQVERTGKDQRGRGFIHADDVVEFLLEQTGITRDQVAIKSSETDDIEGLDLLDRDCPVRFIITKSALQEGWDCPFAYVLTVLTNPNSQLSITQLVGRVLRQPGAVKTGVPALDECYVHCFQRKAVDVVAAVKDAFNEEGLGDLSNHVVLRDESEAADKRGRPLGFRPEHKSLEGAVYLPKFVIEDGGAWRDVHYESDILSRVGTDDFDLAGITSMVLPEQSEAEQEVVVGLGTDNTATVVSSVSAAASLAFDEVYATRLLTEVVPNPWQAHLYVQQSVKALTDRYSADRVAQHGVSIVAELKRVLEAQRDDKAEAVFRDLVERDVVRLLAIAGDGAFAMRPSGYEREGERRLTRSDATPIQLSLMEVEYESDFNTEERQVAVFLDSQERLAWWYRNIARGNTSYWLQGWLKQRVYPDFIAREAAEPVANAMTYVLETKGVHLAGSEDTEYKRSLLDLCTKVNARTDSADVAALTFDAGSVHFEVVTLDGWEARLNGLFGESRTSPGV